MDYENSNLPFTHDIYLKVFARICKISDQFDSLIVDEAQDLNPVLIGIVENSGLPAVIVGDNWQSISGFRGAENAMRYFAGDVFSLLTSFRFCLQIALVQQTILRKQLY